MLSESLGGRIALVTGGSRGIGRAIALRLAEAGADVALLYAGNQSAAEDTAEAVRALGVRALALRCDVSDSAQVSEAVKQVRADLGPIDILVNNAGITRDGISLRMKEEGAFLMTQAVMSDFVRRRRGRVINISSVSGLMGNAGQANYSSAKAGMIGLTKTIAKELGLPIHTINPLSYDWDKEIVRIADLIAQ